MVFKIDISLSAEPRKELGKGVAALRQKKMLPAVLYGCKIKNFNLILDLEEFKSVFKKAGESSLINLKIKGEKESLTVLIHDFQKDPLSGEIIHVDFYYPDLGKKIKTSVPIKVVGVSPAIKNSEGTLIKNITELEVSVLPTKIPHEIIVNIDSLETIGSEIFVKDLSIPEGVDVLRDPGEVVLLIVSPTRVEEELEKPIEEKVEEIKGVVKEGEKEENEGEGEKTVIK